MSSAFDAFKSENAWCGGHYEIEFELEAPSDERLKTAVQAIWSYPSLEGCYPSREQQLHNQPRLDARLHAAEGHLYGGATLPTGCVACGTCVCRPEDKQGHHHRDLVSFYLPLRALSKIYPIGAYPFSDIDRAAEWRPILDEWLVDMGRFVFDRVQFRLALIGFEVDFHNVSAATIEQTGVPIERYDGFLWQERENLAWYPPTNLQVVRIVGRAKSS